MNIFGRSAVFCVILFSSLFASGCGVTFWGIEYPAFWEQYTDIDTMTVSPPRNESNRMGTEYTVAQEFVAYLRNNAPYAIESYVDASKNPENINTIYNYALNRDPNAANAYVEITLLTTNGWNDVVEKVDEIIHYVRDENGNIVVENGVKLIDHIEKRRYLEVTNSAEAVGKVDIVSPNNDVNHWARRSGYCSDTDGPDRVYSIDYLMDCALRDLGIELAMAVTPHSQRMRMSKDDFKIALYNDAKQKYVESKKIALSDGKMYVLVSLPAVARLNKFKITIEAEVNDQKVVLDTQTFIYDGVGTETFAYDIDKVAAMADTKDFTFRLSIGNDSILKREITIEK